MKVVLILCVVVVAAAMARPQGQGEVINPDPAFYRDPQFNGAQVVDPGYYQNGVHVVDNNPSAGQVVDPGYYQNGVHVVDNNPSAVNVVNGPYPQHLNPPSGGGSYPQHLNPPGGSAGVIYNVDPFFYQGGQGRPPNVINNQPYPQHLYPPNGWSSGGNVDIGPTFVNQGTWNRPPRVKPNSSVHPGARNGK